MTRWYARQEGQPAEDFGTEAEAEARAQEMAEANKKTAVVWPVEEEL